MFPNPPVAVRMKCTCAQNAARPAVRQDMMLEHIGGAEGAAVVRETAMEIIDELEQLNVLLEIEGLRQFIGSEKKELRLA